MLLAAVTVNILMSLKMSVDCGFVLSLVEDLKVLAIILLSWIYLLLQLSLQVLPLFPCTIHRGCCCFLLSPIGWHSYVNILKNFWLLLFE